MQAHTHACIYSKQIHVDCACTYTYMHVCLLFHALVVSYIIIKYTIRSKINVICDHEKQSSSSSSSRQVDPPLQLDSSQVSYTHSHMSNLPLYTL